MTDWLAIAAQSFSASTTYMDANYRKNFEESLSMFHGKHAAGSKYNSDSYKHRSRLFRPKTRSMVRKNESAAAAAFFSNLDVVDIQPQAANNEAQAASAELMRELLQYRLTKQRQIPWYRTLIGAFQDAQVMGAVCSYQAWRYEEKRTTRTVQSQDPFGNIVEQQVEDVEIVFDQPEVKLIPLENCRFDPACDWTDPVNSSPYFIQMVPMYLGDIVALMNAKDTKTGMPKFKKIDPEKLREAIAGSMDTTAMERDNNREDPKSGVKAHKDFEIAWVHRNFVRKDGDEWFYYTLGTVEMLTDPVLLKDAYFHNVRPYAFGVATIEAHRALPDSLVSLGGDLQKEANEVVNQRMDNVKLVLNKRWMVKRGTQADIQSLVKNVPGAVTMVNDIGDVQEINWPDVTSSAFAEQDRINVDYDELVGNFSIGSVQTNRQLNETVGGMGLIASGANMLGEYLLKTFTETWVEPVIHQLILLEQHYETDAKIANLAAGRADLFQKYGIDQVTDELLNQDLTMTVNVGMGATDPTIKLQKFLSAMNSFMSIAANSNGMLDLEQVSKEIFALSGQKNGAKFLSKDQQNPQLIQMQQQIEQLTQMLQAKDAELKARLQDTQMKIQSDQAKTEFNAQVALQKQKNDLQFKYEELGVKSDLEHMAHLENRIPNKLTQMRTLDYGD